MIDLILANIYDKKSTLDPPFLINVIKMFKQANRNSLG